MFRTLHAAWAALVLFAWAAPASAEAGDILGPESLSVVGDFRLVTTRGETSWTDGGFGKARFGGDTPGWRAQAVPAEVALVWRPRFSWSVSGTIVAAVQKGEDHPADLVEAFLAYKPLPSGSTRFSAKAGLYWPQISLEHEGAAWQVADMITPSAINSWVGEEVKVIGAEATLAQQLGSAQLSGTAGVFGFNDTAGTLISFRGWALHDLKATAFGHERLPPLAAIWDGAQAKRTRPLIEIDNKPGFYGRLALRMAAPVTLDAFYYRNRGVPEAITDRLQWGWDTRFWNFGARVDLGPRTRVLAQYLTGTTEMGFEEEGRYWVETRYRSAYARVSHRVGAVTLSGRYDWFRTRERGSWMERAESERGWAATADASWTLSPRFTLLGELLRIDSRRGTRERIGLTPRQTQTVIQASLRFSL